MALFKTNYKDLQDQLVPAGTYECIIEDTRPDATPGGTEYIRLNLRIRKDLDKALPDTNGKQHNRLLFVSLWRRKKTGKYDPSDLNYIMKAAGYPENTEVKDWDDWTKKLTGKPVKVKVSIDTSVYKGETRKRDQVWASSFKKTDYPLQGSKNPFKGNEGSNDEIDDSSLPF